MTDYANFKHGGVSYPLAITADPLLKSADPAMYYALDYFQSVLNTYLGPRLLAEASRAPAIASITAAVSSVLPMDPLPYLQEQQFKFPLLAVYRKSEKFSQLTAAVGQDDSEWCVDYILPPLTGGQLERINPALRAVGQILYNRIENMMDPDYADGAAIWTLAGIAKIELTEASYGAFSGTGNLVFPAWRGKLTVKEVATLTGTGSASDNLEDLKGVDNEVDLTGTLPADATTEVIVHEAVGAGVYLSPDSATVIAGATQTFTAEGGSGLSVVFTLLVNNSGGSINSSTGVYTAGATTGVYDLVGVSDSYSAAITNAVIQVI
jgi:hypothetical protein